MVARRSDADRKGTYGKAAYKRARRALLAGDPPCIHQGPRCAGRATEADHQPPVKLHDHVEGSGCCILVPTCGPCARSQGGKLSQGVVPKVRPTAIVEPDPVPRECFDVPWLADLLDVPDDATWPRLMTAPHPDAVGSYGELVEAYSAAFHGRPLRWWQRLAARRLLEHDAAGHLVWGAAVLTVARQVGKSYLLGDLCAWRLHSGDLFGCPQTVVSTGKDLAVVKEMQRPHMVAAKRDRSRYHPREVNGQEEIELLADSSRWMLRAKEAVYGLSVSLATVDEAWKVLASIVDDGIEPTTVEADDAQILLVSTAHRRATALMVGRRASALAHLGDGEGPLLLEWSAPPGAELDDRDGWRMASPYWSHKRDKHVEKRLQGALSGESDDVDEPDPIVSFRTQWLNQWPSKRLGNVKGDPLVDSDDWAALAGVAVDNRERIYVAVEDFGGLGAAVAAVCEQPDGRYGVDGWLCNTWTEAMTDVRRLMAHHDVTRLQAGASLLHQLPPGMRATPVTSAVTRSTLPLLRQLAATGAIIHDSADLAEQIDAVRVTEAVGGLMVVPGMRSDLLRAASWALAAASRPRKEPSIH
jgi:hypothetical protein